MPRLESASASAAEVAGRDAGRQDGAGGSSRWGGLGRFAGPNASAKAGLEETYPGRIIPGASSSIKRSCEASSLARQSVQVLGFPVSRVSAFHPKAKSHRSHCSGSQKVNKTVGQGDECGRLQLDPQGGQGDGHHTFHDTDAGRCRKTIRNR